MDISVTVYRGHRRALCFPARDYLAGHHVHRNYLKNSFFSRRTHPGRGSNRSSATANVMLYCTWRPSGLTIGLHGQGYIYNLSKVSLFCLSVVDRAPFQNGRTQRAVPCDLFRPSAIWLLHAIIVSYCTMVATPRTGEHWPASLKYVAPWIILPRRNNVSVKSAAAVNTREPKFALAQFCFVNDKTGIWWSGVLCDFKHGTLIPCTRHPQVPWHLGWDAPLDNKVTSAANTTHKFTSACMTLATMAIMWQHNN